MQYLKDWRFFLFLLLFASFYPLFFLPENWFIFTSILIFTICSLAILVCQQKLFFLVVVLFFFSFHFSYLSNYPTSRALKECNYQPQNLQAHLNKKDKGKLFLSKITFYCNNKKYYLASAILLAKKRYIPTYSGEKIFILNPKINFQQKKLFFSTTRNTKFFSARKRILEQNRSSLWQYWYNKSDYYLKEKAKELYQGIALADRSALSKDLREKISTLGIFHLFAISGLHIGMIFLWTHFLLSKILNLISFFRKNSFLSLLGVDLFSLLIVLIYLEFIVYPITALRAWIMLFFWVLIRNLFYWLPSLYVLLLTALLMILITPSIIFSLSFQFSFLAVFAILIFHQWTNFAPTSLAKIYKNFFYIAIMTLLINFFTAPLSLVYFGKINYLNFINNPFHILFISFIYLPLVLLGFFTSIFNLDAYYFWLMQKVGDFWFFIMEKNYAYSSFALISWKKNFANYWWGIYGFILTLFSLISFQIRKPFQQKYKNWQK